MLRFFISETTGMDFQNNGTKASTSFLTWLNCYDLVYFYEAKRKFRMERKVDPGVRYSVTRFSREGSTVAPLPDGD